MKDKHCYVIYLFIGGQGILSLRMKSSIHKYYLFLSSLNILFIKVNLFNTV